MAIVKTWTIANVGDDAEKLEPLYISGRNVKWRSHFEKALVTPYTVKHTVTIWLSNSAPRYSSDTMFWCTYIYICP
jgi:hypothetical protein